MEATKIRKEFLEFFRGRGHSVRPSDSLVPASDPTLLFTSAGMVQFKSLWTTAPLEFQRAASVQKCLRVGGKDSDLENVGRTLRHQSFFEMLGNFSFGDYFKKEAIEWAWEFVIEVMKLEREAIWISVYRDDDEAFDLWKKRIGIPEEKIVRLGDKDNFWGPAGSKGPCGPCSELYFDRGPAFGCGKPSCRPGCDCERYLEFWNLVFPQFYQEEGGERRPLERRGIDTGMGLERLALLSQGAASNYETDLFQPIISNLASFAPRPYDSETRSAYRVIADHIRALTFTVSENILPSNLGRGYIVRRLLRRAARFGRKLGLNEPFLYRLAPVVVEVMKDPYPGLLESRDHVGRIIRAEEERFSRTLTTGLERLKELAHTLKEKKKILIPGDEVFKLYDTYGFPPELTEEVAGEEGLSLDWTAFQESMDKQKERGRNAWKGSPEKEIPALYQQLSRELSPTEFRGYERLALRTAVSALLREDRRVKSAGEGEEIEITLKETPFYAESGGQVGDTGLIQAGPTRIKVLDTQRPLEGLTVHRGKIISGSISAGEEVEALVDRERRRAIERHHTATHLLQHALREILGDHVSQAGSYVGPEYFRFDFSHFQALTDEDLKRVEARVNEMIRADDPVRIYQLSLREAKKQGALAFFGEKYGERVRMIDVGGYSRELCGGTHVARTGEIGLFYIMAESSVAAGVRRIEACCGERAYLKMVETNRLLREAAGLLKTSPDKLPDRVKSLTGRIKSLESEKEASLRKDALRNLDRFLTQARVVEGVKVIAAELAGVPMNGLRQACDLLKQKTGSGIVVLGSTAGTKVHLVAGVTGDLIKRGYHAGQIVKEISQLIGGSGGGRPDLAQAGGKKPEQLPAALEAVYELVSNRIST
jgi:alanyl-tRNA synthetase